MGKPPHGGGGCDGYGLELAGFAVVGGGLHPGAFEGALAHPDVVDGLDSLAPCVDSCSVDIACGGGVREKQGARRPLVHPVGGHRVGVDQLLVAQLIRVLKQVHVVLGHMWCGVVHAPGAPLLPDLDWRDHGVDGRCAVVDVADRAGRRDGLQVRVGHAVLVDLQL